MNGFCYDDGQVNQKNITEMCDVEKSTVRWSLNDEGKTQARTTENNVKPKGRKQTKEKPRRRNNNGKEPRKKNNDRAWRRKNNA
jgi:hypothetical protein